MKTVYAIDINYKWPNYCARFSSKHPDDIKHEMREAYSRFKFKPPIAPSSNEEDIEIRLNE